VVANIRTEIVGANDAIRALNKIEPGLRKQFAAEATEIAQPAITEAQRRYQNLGVPLSGMARNWQTNGRKVFPYNPAKAARNVKIRLDSDRRRTAVILLEQRDAGTAIFETAAVGVLTDEEETPHGTLFTRTQIVLLAIAPVPRMRYSRSPVPAFC
jgi:hypothetical protein